MEESIPEDEEEEFDKEGLGTQLRPKSKGAHNGSDELENFEVNQKGDYYQWVEIMKRQEYARRMGRWVK